MTREWIELLCLANTVLLIGAIVRLQSQIWSLRRWESRQNRAHLIATTQPLSLIKAKPVAATTELREPDEASLWKAAHESDPEIAAFLQSACVTSLQDLLKLPDLVVQDICAEAGLETTLTAILTLDDNVQQTMLRALSPAQRRELEKTLQRRSQWNDFTRRLRSPSAEVTELSCQTLMALAQKRVDLLP